MESWQLDFEWLRTQHLVQNTMKRETLPDLNTVLFLVGIQELGRWKRAFTKEEKQDLMHIGICRLLSDSGYYELESIDQDGWPHYTLINPLPKFDLIEQEKLLRMHIKEYFKNL